MTSQPLPTYSDNLCLLSSILDSSLEGIVCFQAIRNSDNRIIDFQWLLLNKKAKEFYGTMSESFVGRTLKETLPESLEKELFYRYIEVIETGKPYHNEHWYNYNPLPNRWIEVSVVKNKDGVVVTFSDITEIKNEQKEIEKLKQSLWIVESLPLPAWTIQLDGKTDYFNDRYLEETGLTLQECLNNNGWVKAVHSEDLERLYQGAKFLQLYHYYETEYRLFNARTKTYRWQIGRIVAVRNNSGEIIKWVGISIDIHDLKQALESVEQSKQEVDQFNKELKNKNVILQSINDELDNFIYIASHDLKAPIANLEGLLLAMEKETDNNTEQKQLLNMMFTSVCQLKETIKELTDITKVQRDEPEDIQLVCLKEILDEARVTIKNLIEEKQAEIISDFEITTVNFSKKNARSLLYNLISNSIKYASPDRTPKIVISTRKDEGYTVLTVADNGLGIHKENISKVFGMFKRFHNHVDGTGVGLYIVKKMVEKAGGKIEIESKLGEGTTMKVYFRNHS